MAAANLNINSKILLVLVAVAASSTGIIGFLEYQAAKDSLRVESFNKLTAVREMKAQQIEDYFKAINNQIITFSESETAVRAVQNFNLAFNITHGQQMRRKHNPGTKAKYSSDIDALNNYYETEFLPRLRTGLIGETSATIEQFVPKPEAVLRLQDRYITKNPHPTGTKHRFDGYGDDDIYDNLHKRYHPVFRSFLEKFGYYDIFLVEPKTGHIVYSVFKEVDFGTSLLTGPYKDSNFAAVFKKAKEAKDSNAVFLADFQPYAPSYNAPASFIASPIFEGTRVVGVAVFQMPIDRINQIMTSQNAWKEVGLGASGETYIVADDFLMRNQSRFLIEDRINYLQMIRSVGTDENTVGRIEAFNSSIGLQQVKTKGTVAALSGKTNTEIFPDYRGVRVLSSYRPLKLSNLKWAIMSEIDEAEAFAAAEALKQKVMILGISLLVAIIGVSFVFARTMTRPIKTLTAQAEALARGELETKINTSGSDEISQLARSFDVMRNALRELIEDLESRVEQRTRELQNSETRTRSIIENAADGIIVINTQGVIQEFSPAAELIFGYKAVEVIGKKINGLMPAPHHSEHDSYLKRYLETGEKKVVGQNREVEGKRKDGSTFPMDLAVGEAILDKERVFTGIIRDITDRKIAEKEIADKEAQLRMAMENMSDGMYVLDGDMNIRLFNDQYASLAGIPENLLALGNPIEPIIQHHAKQGDYGNGKAEEIVAMRLEGLANDEYIEREISVKNGEVELELRKAPLEEGGAVVVLSDITKRKALERELSIANKRMGDELNIGREIQMSMIPLTFPRFPEHKDIDVWAYLRPAREVGGDFYDFFFVDEKLFAFVIADVSGKGVPAALLMAVAKTLLKSHSQETGSTARIVELTNNELSQNNKDCMFITAFFGLIDTSTGELTYTNAGHNPPYLMEPNGAITALDGVHGPMIGAMEGVPYEEAAIKLNIDDKLLLFTDGITEAFDANRQAYGEERLEEMLTRSGNLGTKYLVDALVQEVDDFVAEAEQSDDITVFCLRYVAWEGRDERALIELHLKNELAEVERCLQALAEFCERFDMPAEVQQSVSIVLDDLLNNVVSYAFEDEEEHLIEVSLATDKERFIVTVTDDGVEFDPFTGGPPDIESGIEERQIGGLGIHLIKNLMDDFSYRRIDGKNTTILMKRMGN